MPVNEPALSEANLAPSILVGMKRCSTWPVRVLNTITGWLEPISSTAALLSLGLSATALATTGEPRSTMVPAGVRVWLLEATMEPSLCGPTVRLGSSAARTFQGEISKAEASSDRKVFMDFFPADEAPSSALGRTAVNRGLE